jgi:hypothetical protein
MSTRTLSELFTEVHRITALMRAHPANSPLRQEDSAALAELFEEIKCRSSAALGAAFATTFADASQGNPSLTIALGDRLTVELRRRGLEVIPMGELPPV